MAFNSLGFKTGSSAVKEIAPSFMYLISHLSDVKYKFSRILVEAKCSLESPEINILEKPLETKISLQQNKQTCHKSTSRVSQQKSRKASEASF